MLRYKLLGIVAMFTALVYAGYYAVLTVLALVG